MDIPKFAPTIRVKRGDTYTRTINLKTNDELIDATGYTIYFTVRASAPDTSDSDDSGATIAKTISGEATGIHSLELSSTDTNEDSGTYYFEFQVKNASGKIYSTITGKFIIEDDLTRSTS